MVWSSRMFRRITGQWDVQPQREVRWAWQPLQPPATAHRSSNLCDLFDATIPRLLPFLQIKSTVMQGVIYGAGQDRDHFTKRS